MSSEGKGGVELGLCGRLGVWQTGVGVAGGLAPGGDVCDANNCLVLGVPVDNGI